MENTPLKIYIVGPYTAETTEQMEDNVNRAIDAAFAIFAKGHYPYVPHLTHYVDLRAKATGVNLQWEDYIRWDMAWVEICDALLYLSPSRGANIELQAAKDLGKKIFYSLEQISSVHKLSKLI
jgi:Domain of unknown function (DUF4406)